MFCPECGSNTRKGQKFCGKCGASILNENADVTTQHSPQSVPDFNSSQPVRSDQASKSKLTVGSVAGWIFGVIVAMGGLGSFVGRNPGIISGLVLLMMAAVMIPPIRNIIEEKTGRKLTKGLTAIIIVIGFILFALTEPDRKAAVKETTEPPVKSEAPSRKSNDAADDFKKGFKEGWDSSGVNESMDDLKKELKELERATKELKGE